MDLAVVTSFDRVNAMFDKATVGQVLSYQEDTYLTEDSSVVLGVDERGALTLACCLFHPQGGGQPADRGWVEDVAVNPIRDTATGRVVLVPDVDEALVPGWAVGATVTTRVDRVLRLRHAALHTAGHLIEAAGRSLGWELAGNNHFPGQARIEFTPGEGTVPDSPDRRERASEALRRFVAEAVICDLAVVSDTGEDGRRVVSIGQVHAAPCGGTHVRSLAALAGVELEVKVKKGRIRVSYTAEHVAMP